MNLKKILIALSLFGCGLNSYASMYDSLLQTREEARESYNVQREIARANNDSSALWQLNNNYNQQTRDVMEDYYNRAFRPSH